MVRPYKGSILTLANSHGVAMGCKWPAPSDLRGGKGSSYWPDLVLPKRIDDSPQAQSRSAAFVAFQ